MEWWGEGRAVFRDPRGGVHTEERPDPPELPEDPASELEAENRRRDADPGPRAAGARWTGRGSVPDEVWYAALEAGFAAVYSAAMPRLQRTAWPYSSPTSL